MRKWIAAAALGGLLVIVSSSTLCPYFQSSAARSAALDAPAAEPSRWIVRGARVAVLRSAVAAVGGRVTHELEIISAVAAELTPAQAEALRAHPAVTLFADHGIDMVGRSPSERARERWRDVVLADVPEAEFRRRIGIDEAYARGFDGDGVTIAVIDTGYWSNYGRLTRDLHGERRVRAEYNAITDSVGNVFDGSGHGTHITSIMVGSRPSGSGAPMSVAPMADLVVVKAFDADARGSYADVIRGMDWLLKHRERLDVRVINLSFSAEPRSFYWDDPLNQAVMAAWHAGIVVVTSAGNGGPEPMTVGTPGNVPYIITVGAMTDNYTPADLTDDRPTTFTAAGPTYEGFVKPDLMAPGGHLVGVMREKYHRIAQEHPEFALPGRWLYQMSGT